ncbi:MAG: glycosyltransferase family 4 protein [Rectinemataceae bacterium]
MNYRPYHLAHGLVELGRDVTVISASTSHEYFSPPITSGFYTIEDVDGIRYVWVRTPGYGESRSLGRILAWAVFLFGLMRLSSLHLPLPGSIVVSSPPPYPILVAAILAKRFYAKLVFEVRDLWPLSLVELGGISVRHPFIRLTQWVEGFAYRRADRVVSVLPLAESHMASHGMGEGKFACIPNGVEVGPLYGKAPDPRIRVALPGRTFIIGYAGKVGIAYGIRTLIEAASLLRDRRDLGFAIVGGGSELEELKAEATTRGLDNLVFVPPVSKAEIPGILAAFDICYLGLRAESLFGFGVSPTKLFDYLLASKPVIMGIKAGNDPVAAAACGLTIEPENPEALAKAVVNLASRSSEERAALGAKGREYVTEYHDWSKLSRAYEAVFAP